MCARLLDRAHPCVSRCETKHSQFGFSIAEGKIAQRCFLFRASNGIPRVRPFSTLGRGAAGTAVTYMTLYDLATSYRTVIIISYTIVGAMQPGASGYARVMAAICTYNHAIRRVMRDSQTYTYCERSPPLAI